MQEQERFDFMELEDPEEERSPEDIAAHNEWKKKKSEARARFADGKIIRWCSWNLTLRILERSRLRPGQRYSRLNDVPMPQVCDGIPAALVRENLPELCKKVQ